MGRRKINKTFQFLRSPSSFWIPSWFNLNFVDKDSAKNPHSRKFTQIHANSRFGFWVAGKINKTAPALKSQSFNFDSKLVQSKLRRHPSKNPHSRKCTQIHANSRFGLWVADKINKTVQFLKSQSFHFVSKTFYLIDIDKNPAKPRHQVCCKK